MATLRISPKAHTYCGLFFLSLLLFIGWGTLAQDNAATEEPPVEIPKEETPPPAEASVIENNPGQSPDIPVSPEPVIPPNDPQPSELPPTMLPPTLLPPTGVEPTLGPLTVVAPTDVSPTLLPSPTLDYTAEPTIAATVEPTSLTLPTALPTIASSPVPDIPLPIVEAQTSHLSGRIQSLWPMGEATIVIAGNEVVQMTTTGSDGSFEFDLPPGNYQLRITASSHLTFTIEFELGGQPFALPTILLTGGDLDGNEMVDMADVELLVQNFGRAVPPAPLSVDLNGDARIDLYDLAIAGARIPVGS